MKRAMFVRRIKIGAGDALLYKLSDPVKFHEEQETCDVVVSAVTSPIGVDIATIFPSNKEGEILSFKAVNETKGTLDHEAPLVELGYEVM